MRMLLTSAGVKNDSIRSALVGLLGRPIEDATALCIPTAMYGHPAAGLDRAWQFAAGRSEEPMVDLGWKSVGLLELAALPSLPRERWAPWVERADVLLASGGDALYLAHWMRESGLVDLLAAREQLVWLGMSAGSMVMAPGVGADFIQWPPPGGEDRALGLVDFAICPHLASEGEPGNSMQEAEAWASTMPCPSYAIDDQSAIRVVDGKVDVVSEGSWRRFPDSHASARQQGEGHTMTERTARHFEPRGTLTANGERGVLRLEIAVTGSIDQVWVALTEPARLAEWYGRVDGDLRVGGRYHAVLFPSGWEGDGHVLGCEPGRRLRIESSEPGEPVTVDDLELLDGADGSTRLILVRSRPTTEMLALYAVGTQLHLENLAAHLAGQELIDPEPFWVELRPHYEAIAPN